MTDSIEESILYSFSSFIAYQLADYKNRLKRGIHNEFMDMNSIATLFCSSCFLFEGYDLFGQIITVI